MLITAKYSSTCPTCRLPIAAGSRVEWVRGEKARHEACAAGVAGFTSPLVAAAAPTREPISLERVGRRTYFRGATYPVRRHLRAGGAHWDADAKAWWIGSHEVAEALALSAASAPAEPAEARGPTSRRSRSYTRGRWTGCSCGSLEDQPRDSDCESCRHDS